MGQFSKAGHDGIIAIETRPNLGAYIFTEVFELMGTIGPPNLSRDTNARTPHKDLVETHLVGGVIKRPALTLDVDVLPEHAPHDITDGFQYYFQSKERFGFNYQGPNFIAAFRDDRIDSVSCVGIEITDGDNANPHSMKITIQADGPYIVNGIIYGNVGSWA